MLVTEDIIVYYSPIEEFKKLLHSHSFYKEVYDYSRVNLKGLYKLNDFTSRNFYDLENEPLVKFHDGIINYYFEKEPDMLLFKLKYGI